MIDSVYVNTDRSAISDPKCLFKMVWTMVGEKDGLRQVTSVLSYSANVKNCKTLNLKKYMYTLKPGMT